MNEFDIRTPATSDEASNPEGRISLLDLLQVVLENIKLLIGLPVVAAAIAYGISFFIPPTYTASASFLPPQQQQGAAANILQSLGAIGGLQGGASALKNPNDQFVSFLKSNSVEDELISRFSLQERYSSKFKVDARKKLEKNTRIVSGKDNIVVVEFDDRVPDFAAKVANAYGEELTKLLGRLALTEAQQRRAFFGKQLAAAKDSLITAEQALSATGVSVAALNANPVTALAGTATLRAQITAQEVSIGAMRSYLTESAPEVRQAQAQLGALRLELSKAQSAQPTSGPGGNDYIAKFREFKYQETLFDIFSRQFEIARVDESRESAPLQIIDVAQAPERPAKPRKVLIAGIAAAATAVLFLFFIFLRKAWQNSMADADFKARVERLQRVLHAA